MKPRLKKVLRWIGYPTFYVFALLVFGYFTFPYERVRDRIVAEYNAQRQPDGYRLEIEELDGYWLSGVRVENATLVPPAPPKKDGDGADAGAPKPRTIEIDEAHARASILSYIFGTLDVSFGAMIAEGNIEGSYAEGSDGQKIVAELEAVDVGGLPYVSDVVGGLPLSGEVTGKIDLTLPESKFAEASGAIELSIFELNVGDGKTKIKDAPLPALPRLRAGDLTFELTAEEGRVQVKKLEAKGPDLELIADGKIRLRDPLDTSLAELNVRFKFTEAYKTKNDITKGLFGKQGLFDLDPKVKRAKRPDGFYGWRMTGPLGNMSFQPSRMSSKRAGAARRPPSTKMRLPKAIKK